MAAPRDRPCPNSNFLVEFGSSDPRSLAGGFSEVIFPEFTLAAGDARADPAQTATGQPAGPVAGSCLVLKRGVVGNLDLYAWWNKARRGKAPQRRTVKVQLLAEDRSTVVLTWRFRNARPVGLSYSPLCAVDGSPLIETLQLAFDGIEIS